MPIDYEAEYNYRQGCLSIPKSLRAGHVRPRITAQKPSKSAAPKPRPLLRLILAPGDRSLLQARVATPLALFIHGGYWRALDPSLFSQMARGANAHGIAVAVVGDDLCPQVTISEIIDQFRRACLFLWLRTGSRMMVYGHSAGGHLAAAMVATNWQALYPKAPPDLVPTAYSISGLFV